MKNSSGNLLINSLNKNEKEKEKILITEYQPLINKLSATYSGLIFLIRTSIVLCKEASFSISFVILSKPCKTVE